MLGFLPDFKKREEEGVIPQSFLPHLIELNQDICTACGDCVKACDRQAIRVAENKYETDPFSCDSCMICVDLCEANSIRVSEFENGKEEESSVWVKELPILVKSCQHCGHQFHQKLNGEAESLRVERFCPYCRKVKHLRGDLRIYE